MIMAKQLNGRPKKLKLRYKEDYKKLVMDEWKYKAMHGKFPKYLDKDYVDTELSFQWNDTTASTSPNKEQLIPAEHVIKKPRTVEHIISGC